MCLVRQGKILGAFKLARQMLDKIHALKIPSRFQVRFVLYLNLFIFINSFFVYLYFKVIFFRGECFFPSYQYHSSNYIPNVRLCKLWISNYCKSKNVAWLTQIKSYNFLFLGKCGDPYSYVMGWSIQWWILPVTAMLQMFSSPSVVGDHMPSLSTRIIIFISHLWYTS